MLHCSQAAGDQHPQQAHLLEQHGRGGPEAARQLPGSEGGEPGQCSGGEEEYNKYNRGVIDRDVPRTTAG